MNVQPQTDASLIETWLKDHPYRPAPRETTKVCAICRAEKSRSEFYPRHGKCKDCARATMVEYRQHNPRGRPRELTPEVARLSELPGRHRSRPCAPSIRNGTPLWAMIFDESEYIVMSGALRQPYNWGITDPTMMLEIKGELWEISAARVFRDAEDAQEETRRWNGWLATVPRWAPQRKGMRGARL